MPAFRPLFLCAFVHACLCPTARAQQAPAPPRADAITNSIGMKLVRIPAGEFQMGSTDADRDADPDEQPRRRVRISQPFYMGECEVTQDQYAAVMGADHSWFSLRGPGRRAVAGQDTGQFPVDMASWQDAAEFCDRLSELPAEKTAGRRYRLPTEAEWEYACRAGGDALFGSADRLTPDLANVWFGEPAGKLAGRPVAVGSYAPNAWGLRDMQGNVWEWCADWYAHDYYRRAPAQDPPGPEAGVGHVVRGGDWSFGPRHARAANRDFTRTTRRNLGTGFRVACQAEGVSLP